MAKKFPQVCIGGVEFVPRALLEEALSIISGLSQLYDDLAANPSEPTKEERRRESKLDQRWTKLVDKANPPVNKQVEGDIT